MDVNMTTSSPTVSEISDSQMSYKNYPFRAMYDYKPRPHDPGRGGPDHVGAISMSAGDLGEILDDQPDNGWIRVDIKGKQGGVPLDYIEVGRRRTTERVLRHDFVGISGNIVDLSNLRPHESRPKQVFRRCAQAFAEHEQELYMAEDVRKLVLSDSEREARVDLIVDGLDLAMENLLDNPTATFEDLQRMVRVDSNERRTGQYLRMTHFFPSSIEKLPESYVGVTGNSFYARLQQHKSARDDTFSAKSAAEAVYCDMWVIGTYYDDNTTVALAEQIFIEMIGSQHAELLKPSIPLLGSNTLQHAIREVPKRWAGHGFYKVCNAVFDAMQFVPLCQRTTFMVGQGLNYEPPAFVGGNPYERHQWVKYLLKDRAVFQRPITWTARGSVKIAAYRNYGDESGVHAPVLEVTNNNTDGGDWPEIGSRAELLVEIMRPGKRADAEWPPNSSDNHKHPFARLPQTGVYSDWQCVNAVAVKIRWTYAMSDSGMELWKERYLQRDRIGKFIDDTGSPDDHGSYILYPLVTGLYRYLMQVGQDENRSWDCNFGIAEVKELTFDWLEQTAYLLDAQPPSPPGNRLAAVREMTWFEKCAVLTRMGAQNVGIWSTDERLNDFKRKRCDLCYIQGHFQVHSKGVTKVANEGIIHGCVLKVGTSQCERSWKQGWPCSWTPSGRISYAMIEAFAIQEFTAVTTTEVTNLDAGSIGLS